MSDPKLGRFWAHRAEDSVRREKQLLIDFLCQSASGPLFYTGRDMSFTCPYCRKQDLWGIDASLPVTFSLFPPIFPPGIAGRYWTNKVSPSIS